MELSFDGQLVKNHTSALQNKALVVAKELPVPSGAAFQYTFLRHHRARRIRLTVRSDGSVLVTAPRRAPLFLIERFVWEKAEWVREKIDFFKAQPGGLFPKLTGNEYRRHRQAALNLAKQKVIFFNKRYHFFYNAITVRNQRTRWGSCSRKKNLNFNYKIALLPERFVDYIIVHELCHLQELNHSREFWQLVEHAIPDYRIRLAELKKVRV